MIQSNAPSIPTTYRNERDYPFCPGCGHGLILNHLNAALVKLEEMLLNLNRAIAQKRKEQTV
jgi:pyruvate/2-oxoacid:ferredoxin oxidoreductase beta subunit